ncbi:MAG: hypothetical protein ACRC80_11975 [Waterburya sp.]
MGININDLQPLDSSLLSGSNKALGNLRELLPKELKITGGKKDDDDEYFYTSQPGDGCIPIASTNVYPASGYFLYRCPKE